MAISVDSTPTLDVVPRQEEVLLREAVAGICSDFGPAYSQRLVEEGEPPDRALGRPCEPRLPGREHPEEYGGGGLGMAALATVGEEIAAAGCSLLLIVVSPAIAGSILTRHGSPSRRTAGCAGSARAPPSSPSRSPSPTPAPTRTTCPPRCARERRQVPAERAEDLHLRRRGGRRGAGRGPHAQRRRLAGAAVARDRRRGRPRLHPRRDPDAATCGPDKQWTLFFDDVEMGEERLIGGENGGLGPVFDGLNPERIMGASMATGIGALRARARAPTTRGSATSGARRSAPTRASRHPLAQAKIELELARLMTQKAAALYDAGAKGAGEASNMAKYAAAEAAIHCVDQAIQTHGGNGFALEYGLSQMWWGVRADAHRAGLARDDPQLRGRALARPAQVLRPGRDRVGAGVLRPGRRAIRRHRADPRAVGRDSQHAGPPCALLGARARPRRRARRGAGSRARPSRSSGPCRSRRWSYRAEVVRPGRSVELVEGTLSSDGEDADPRARLAGADHRAGAGRAPPRRAAAAARPRRVRGADFFPVDWDVGYHTAMEVRFATRRLRGAGPRGGLDADAGAAGRGGGADPRCSACWWRPTRATASARRSTTAGGCSSTPTCRVALRRPPRGRVGLPGRRHLRRSPTASA